jgi:hypothetical protein
VMFCCACRSRFSRARGVPGALADCGHTLTCLEMGTYDGSSPVGAVVDALSAVDLRVLATARGRLKSLDVRGRGGVNGEAVTRIGRLCAALNTLCVARAGSGARDGGVDAGVAEAVAALCAARSGAGEPVALVPAPGGADGFVGMRAARRAEWLGMQARARAHMAAAAAAAATIQRVWRGRGPTGAVAAARGEAAARRAGAAAAAAAATAAVYDGATALQRTWRGSRVRIEATARRVSCRHLARLLVAAHTAKKEREKLRRAGQCCCGTHTHTYTHTCAVPHPRPRTHHSARIT